MHILGALLAAASAAARAPGARAAVVTERWGVAGHIQHPGTLVYEALPDGKTLMRFDLSALPKKAKVYRARLVMVRTGGPFGQAFDIAPARRAGPAGAVRADRRPLRLIGPWYRWFDATEAAAGAAAEDDRTLRLLLRKAPEFQPEATWLEVAYEGRLRVRSRQVGDVQAFCRAGQVFVTFKEIEDLAGGKADLSWSEFARRVAGWGVDGPVPRDDRRELRYRVYRHEERITASNIARARLVGEVASGSGYNTHLVPAGWNGKKGPPVLRVAVRPPRKVAEKGEAGRPGAPAGPRLLPRVLPPGVGVHVHTVRRPGRRYYAVVTAINGVENTLDLSKANSVGPVAEDRGRPEPVLDREIVSEARGVRFVQRWYSYWCDPPLSPRPLRYDVAVAFCPELLADPAPLIVTRGHAWDSRPEPPGPHRTSALYLSHSSEWPNAFWMGVNDAYGTLKGVRQGRWQPFPQRRQEALIRWAQRQWRVDRTRVVGAIGAWGMMEIERGGLYSRLVGWGLPEVTKGFQAWDRAVGAWGPPAAYAGRPDEEDPYVRQDASRFVRRDPRTELPYFALRAGWGMHLTEMGWPPFPRFLRAMIDTKRAFVASWDQRSPWSWRATPVHRAVARGRIDVSLRRSLPAFGHCSLDDNPGAGALGAGDLNGQINGYLLWESDTITDEPDRWAVTVLVDETAPRDDCTVDLTPRRCRRFKAEPGRTFRWTNTLLPAAEVAGDDDRKVADAKVPARPGPIEVQSGTATADEHGLVTLGELTVSKARHRIEVRPAGKRKGK